MDLKDYAHETSGSIKSIPTSTVRCRSHSNFYCTGENGDAKETGNLLKVTYLASGEMRMIPRIQDDMHMAGKKGRN